MSDVVRLDRLTKSYGATRGIVELDLQVRAGEVFGFLGPNGAGKTTTIRTMLDLIRPTSGRIVLFGLDARRDGVAVRRRIGYLPGDLRLYDRLTPRELFRYFGALRGLRSIERAERLAARFELELDRPVAALSRGNRQKAGLVQAFMHEPELLVLDEPTSGLDPLVQQTFYEVARETVEAGRTIFLSSHVLSEVQHVADRVGLVREGRLVLVDSVDNLRSHAFTRVAAIGAGGRALAGEEEAGTLDLLLANPVSRRRVAVDKLAALAAEIVGLGVVLWTALWIGCRAAGLHVSAGHLAPATASAVLLAVGYGAIALLVGSITVTAPGPSESPPRSPSVRTWSTVSHRWWTCWSRCRSCRSSTTTLPATRCAMGSRRRTCACSLRSPSSPAFWVR
jgi:ABC-2 type transport system ATP-binding protein